MCVGGGGAFVALGSLSKDLNFCVTGLLPRGYPHGRFLLLFLGSLGMFLFISGKPGVCFYAYYSCSFYFGECRRLFISRSRRFPVTNLAFFKTSVTAIVLSRYVDTVSFSVTVCVQDGVKVPEAAVHVRFCYRINVGLFGSKSSNMERSWRTLLAALSGTFLQTPKGYFVSPRNCPSTLSAPSERFGY